MPENEDEDKSSVNLKIFNNDLIIYKLNEYKEAIILIILLILFYFSIWILKNSFILKKFFTKMLICHILEKLVSVA